MKKTMKKFSMTWVTVWLIASAVAFSGFIGYAAYTGITSVKRVVSTRSGAGFLFSSNYMNTSSTPQVSIEYREYSEFFDDNGDVRETDKHPEYSMIVCNYAQGDKATWYASNNIQYRIQAQLFLNEKDISTGTYKIPTSEDLAPLADNDGFLNFGIKYSNDEAYTRFSTNNLTIALPPEETNLYSLNKTEASTDKFSLLFDRNELKNNIPGFWIKITATPVSVSGGEVETISGYVGTCQNAKSGANWNGYIEDDSYTSVDYDAYNYIISGNGKGTFYFAWDDSKVKPNEFAFLNYANDIDNTATNISTVTNIPTVWQDYLQYGTENNQSQSTWRYIKLNVNSEDTFQSSTDPESGETVTTLERSGIARYEIQLYKTSGTPYNESISTYTNYYFEPEPESEE